LDLATLRASLARAQNRAAFFERELLRLTGEGADTAREKRWLGIYNREASLLAAQLRAALAAKLLAENVDEAGTCTL
jgi:hypothetical protein